MAYALSSLRTTEKKALALRISVDSFGVSERRQRSMTDIAKTIVDFGVNCPLNQDALYCIYHVTSLADLTLPDSVIFSLSCDSL